MADVDAALMKQNFDIPSRPVMPDVHHHGQLDHFVGH